MNEEQAARIARLSQRTNTRRRHVARSGRIIASGLAASGFVGAIGSLAEADARKEEEKLAATAANPVPVAPAPTVPAPAVMVSPTTGDAAPIAPLDTSAPTPTAATQIVVQTVETVVTVGEDGMPTTSAVPVRRVETVVLVDDPIGRIEPADGTMPTPAPTSPPGTAAPAPAPTAPPAPAPNTAAPAPVEPIPTEPPPTAPPVTSPPASAPASAPTEPPPPPATAPPAPAPPTVAAPPAPPPTLPPPPACEGTSC